jgi:hypothetical protein
MMDIYRRAKSEARYNATIFLQMLSRQRGLATARQLINDRNVSSGYTALWETGRLDLTVEAMVLENERWHDLFTADEIERCRKRLNEYQYFG